MFDAYARQEGGQHYKSMPIQPAHFSETNGLSFLEGCIVKRICRWRRGGAGAEDLRKLIHEAELLIEEAERNAPCPTCDDTQAVDLNTAPGTAPCPDCIGA